MSLSECIVSSLIYSHYFNINTRWTWNFVCSPLLNSAAHLQMGRDQMKKKTNSNDQSVKLTRLASLSGGQAFWFFEGRIGWGSCKLPNNFSAQHCTVLNITVFQVYLDHTGAFWCRSFPWLSHILKKSALVLRYESCWIYITHKQETTAEYFRSGEFKKL